MKNEQIRELFDEHAGQWEQRQRRNEANIAEILDRAEMKEGLSVLDVACGTGVLIPDYISRGLRPIVGLDISGEMLKIARSKFPEPQVSFVEADAESYESESRFDRIMVFNSLPHFLDPGALTEHLSALLNPGGILSIAMAMSRARIDAIHKNVPDSVARPLPGGEELKEIFSRFLEVSYCRDDDVMYQVCGVKKP